MVASYDKVKTDLEHLGCNIVESNHSTFAFKATVLSPQNPNINQYDLNCAHTPSNTKIVKGFLTEESCVNFIIEKFNL